MRLKIFSRKSDLARWQAVTVARALESTVERPTTELTFKASLGDQNLDLPLASMGAKGVFTEDFFADLTNGDCDLVVHSWKDLPVEERSTTEIALTLPRADVRDILMIPKTAWNRAVNSGELSILTSSPRRVYNLGKSLAELLPASVQIKFLNVRGNVATRLGKMHEQGCGLVLAKAGLDRLLLAENENFLTPGSSIRALIHDCKFMVLPLSLNPGAPAQGALAVEIARGRVDLKNMFKSIHDVHSEVCVREERMSLASYGGGCHQKIGVSILHRNYGKVVATQGLTDAGEVLSIWEVQNSTEWQPAKNKQAVFPLEANGNSWFDRVTIQTQYDLAECQALMIARAEALPSEYMPHGDQVIWSAGVQTWRKLAARGVWVNGTFDGLGEFEPTDIESILGVLSVNWTKLTHEAGTAEYGVQIVHTYRLVERTNIEYHPDLRGKTHFYWMSASSFERARQLFPKEVLSGYNACGPGHTFEHLKQLKDLARKPKVFIGLEQFLKATL